MLVYYKYFHAKKLGSSMEGVELHTKAAQAVQAAQESAKKSQQEQQESNEPHHPSHHAHAVFNCVLPTSAGTKKKKMPSILPPPPVMPQATNPSSLYADNSLSSTAAETDSFGRAKVPFWKEPLPQQLQFHGQNDANLQANGHSQIYANSLADCKYVA